MSTRRSASMVSALSLAASLAALAALSTGCPPAQTVPGASYAPKTTLAVAAADGCARGCACRSAKGGSPESNVASGRKRFEFRLPPSTSAIWVEVADQGVFFKPPTQVGGTCFYVDLAPGEHRLTVHAENRDPEVGLQAGLTVHEHHAKGPYWYRSLHFVCGGLNKCTKQDLQTWAGFQRRLPRGVLDPCGSVMVRGVSFGGTRSERRADEYEDVTVRMTLKVYDFEPYHAPKSPDCKAPIKNR